MAVETATPVEQLLPPPENQNPGTPEWWLSKLERDLRARRPLIDLYENYYAGRHQLAFATSKFREVFGEMLAAVADNWMELVIQASVERLHIQGFRTAEQATAIGRLRRLLRRAQPAADGTLQGDQDAWDLWQRNKLDLDSRLAFTEASKHGEAYLLVWWDEHAPTGENRARMTVEHPSQVIVERVAGDRRRRAAALKLWCEEDGTHMSNLFLPDHLYRYERAPGAEQWKPRTRDGIAPDEPNPLGVVPVIPLVNDPQMLPAKAPQVHGIPAECHVGLGRSDLANLISTQDSINKLLCDMMVASEVAGFRQRWATGLQLPEDPDTGEPIEPFETAINRLFTSKSKDTKFGDFEATDLRPYVSALENRVQSLSSRSRVPPHYLLGQSGNFPSGESLKATETGLVAKTRGKQDMDEGIEEAVRLGFEIEGHSRAGDDSLETDWEQIESRSESEFTDSLVKKLSIGVPFQQLWEDAGYSPQQIGRFHEMLQEAAREGWLVGPGAAPAPAPAAAGAPDPPPPGGN